MTSTVPPEGEPTGSPFVVSASVAAAIEALVADPLDAVALAAFVADAAAPDVLTLLAALDATQRGHSAAAYAAERGARLVFEHLAERERVGQGGGHGR